MMTISIIMIYMHMHVIYLLHTTMILLSYDDHTIASHGASIRRLYVYAVYAVLCGIRSATVTSTTA
jgi:hypothetical protein